MFVFVPRHHDVNVRTSLPFKIARSGYGHAYGAAVLHQLFRNHRYLLPRTSWSRLARVSPKTPSVCAVRFPAAAPTVALYGGHDGPCAKGPHAIVLVDDVRFDPDVSVAQTHSLARINPENQ